MGGGVQVISLCFRERRRDEKKEKDIGMEGWMGEEGQRM